MSVQIDVNDPIGSLARAGVEYDESSTSSSSSFTVGGVPLAGSAIAGERHAWKLPSPTPLQVVFVPESLSKMVVKIFKRELQMGDPAFDNVVYIDTADKQVTARFLGAEAHRDLVLDFVSEGGRVAVDKDRVVFEVKGSATRDQLVQMAQLVSGVMAL